MAIALSGITLKEIFKLNNDEKLDLVDMIIKSMRSATSHFTTKTADGDSWVDEFEGKWQDSRSTDKIIADLRNSRTENSDVSL